MYLEGIDVSHQQGVIDWNAVAKDPNKIVFAYAKATEGVTVADPLFSANYAGIKSAGIKRGAYHFFHANDPVLEQVQAFLGAVGELAPDDLPPMLDVEVTGNVNRVNLANDIQQWLDQVQVALGRTPIIYTSSGFWNVNVADAKLLAEFPLWIAQYTANPSPTLPDGANTFAYWQYSSSGKIDGISTAVDRDRFNGSLAELGG